MTRPKASFYDLYVGNIGHVATIRTSHARVAESEFEAWCAESLNPFGRAAGEDVTLFKDGHPYREYQPESNHHE